MQRAAPWTMLGGKSVAIGLVLVLLTAFHYIATVRPQKSLQAVPAPSGLPLLPAVVASSTGVYAGAVNPEHDVIVLSANFAYLDFLINWVCTSGNVLNLKYLIVPQDEQLLAFLRNNTDLPVLDGRPLGVSGPAGAAWFATQGFHDVSVNKLRAVFAILKALRASSSPRHRATPHVLFSDVDVVWTRDPYEYLRGDVDLEIQTDSAGGRPEFTPGDDMCTGFYYVRANSKTIALLEGSLDTRHNDQWNVHVSLHALLAAGAAVYVPRNAGAPPADGGRLTFRQLPPLSFPNGAVLASGDFERRRAAAGADLVVVHANWIQGPEAKRKRLHELGLWKVNKTTASCEGQPGCYGKAGDHWLQCATEGEHVTLL